MTQRPLSPKYDATFRDEAYAKKLLWLALLRVGIVTVLLGSTVFIHVTGSTPLLPAALYSLVAGVYFLTIVYVYLVHKRFSHETQAVLQTGADVAIYSVLVYLTGGAESAFTFIYSLAIIDAAILLYRRGALITAAVCTSVFALMVVLEGTRVLPPFEALAPPPHTLAALNTVFTNGAAFFFVALLSSYLSEQLRRTESELAVAKGGLAELRALSENILRSIGDGLLTTSHDGYIRYANDAAREILGRGEDALVGRHISEIFPALTPDPAAWQSALAARYREVTVARPGGAAVLGLSASALRDADQTSRGWLLVFHDLSLLKAMEETVSRSERLAAVGKLAADMAHEIRNPLASMTGSIELMSRDESIPHEMQDLMGIVLREGERLNKLIGDFLDYARPVSPEAAPFDLALVLDETMWMFRHQKWEGVEPTLIADIARPLLIEADLHQVKQVIWNLLKNAVESLDGRGRVTLRAYPSEKGGAYLEIEDEGCGVAEADLPHVFEPFFTTKARGTGLGLATVHRIVDAHGGRIEVASKVGEFTKFTVRFPARPHESADVQSASRKAGIEEAA